MACSSRRICFRRASCNRSFTVPNGLNDVGLWALLHFANRPSTWGVEHEIARAMDGTVLPVYGRYSALAWMDVYWSRPLVSSLGCTPPTEFFAASSTQRSPTSEPRVFGYQGSRLGTAYGSSQGLRSWSFVMTLMVCELVVVPVAQSTTISLAANTRKQLVWASSPTITVWAAAMWR